jgi:hypothetical protein
MNDNDFQSVPLNLESGVLLNLTSLEDALYVPSSPDGTVGTWRPIEDNLSQKAPQISVFSSHESRIERDVRRNEQRLAAMWTNNNFRVLSQLVNSLSLSQSDTDRVLNAVLYINVYLHFTAIQLRHLDSSMVIPSTFRQLKADEATVLDNVKMRVLNMSTVPELPFTTDGVCMVAPDQRLLCMTYDLWQTIQDLLDDGEHAEHAHFRYEPQKHADGGDLVFGECWTGDWWKAQQDEAGPYASILALILYVDETNVTFNGRNVHPVYISLGNLHGEYR